MPRELVEHGGAGEEGELIPGELGQELVAHVVGHVAVVSCESGHPRVDVGLLSEGQGGEIQARRPSLRSLDQRAQLVGTNVDGRLFENRPGFCGRQRKVPRAELRDVTVGAQTPERQPGVAAGCEGQLGLRAKHLRDRAHRRQRRRLVQHVHVVQSEHDRSRRGQSLEDVLPDALDRIKGAADVCHQAVPGRCRSRPG